MKGAPARELTFPSERTRASVLGEADEGARGSVLARAVPARVGGHGDLAEAGRVADRAGALEGGPARARHHHVARPAVLALLPARRARVLVLAVLSHVIRRAAERRENHHCERLKRF